MIVITCLDDSGKYLCIFLLIAKFSQLSVGVICHCDIARYLSVSGQTKARHGLCNAAQTGSSSPEMVGRMKEGPPRSSKVTKGPFSIMHNGRF